MEASRREFHPTLSRWEEIQLADLPAPYDGRRKRCWTMDGRQCGVGSIGGQLGRLLVIASLDPRLGAEKRANERKLVDVEARQLDGLYIQDAVASR